jgi:hypothetical protein
VLWPTELKRRFQFSPQREISKCRFPFAVAKLSTKSESPKFFCFFIDIFYHRIRTTLIFKGTNIPGICADADF